MARWSDLSKLRLDMEMIQAKVRQLRNRGFTPGEIAYTLDIPEQSTRVIIAWLDKRRLSNGS